MFTFTAYRPAAPQTHDEYQKNAPGEPQFEGVIFTDGCCVLRWRTAINSTSVWESLEAMLRIHGHPEYGTYFVFDGEGPEMPRWWLDKIGLLKEQSDAASRAWKEMTGEGLVR